jgi:hypothetical protein
MRLFGERCHAFPLALIMTVKTSWRTVTEMGRCL